MNSVFNIYTFLKTPLFIFLFIFTGSTALAEVKPAETAVHFAGKGLASEIMLTEQEQAWLAQRHTVRVRIAESPPYHMSSPQPHGISVDYLKLIGKRFGINFSFVKSGSTTWQEAVRDLTGERSLFDLLITIKRTPEREKEIAFTQDYLFSPWVIVNRTGSDFISQIKDLNGKKVAVENGFVIKSLIEKEYPQIRIVLCNTSLDALQSVASGGSDAYIANLTIASYLIQKNGLNNLKIAAPTHFGSHDQAMGVRKDWPELASIINKALMAMTEAEKSEINNHWLSIRYDYGINIKKVLIWVIGVTAVFSLVIAAVFIWNRRLRREINNRIRAEEALQKSQSLLLEAQKLGRVGGWEFDIETGQQTWTESVYDIHELDSTGQPTVDQGINFYTPASRPVIEQAVQRAIKQGEPFDLELEIITAKGNLRSVHAIGKADPGRGKVTGFFQDITGQKQAEAALHESASRFRAFVTASSDVLYRMSPDWSEMRHLDGRGFIVDTIKPSVTWLQEYIHPEDQPHVRAAINEAIRTKSFFELEHRVRRVDGTLGWTFSRAIPLLDAQGEIIEWFGAASDVTPRKQYEEAQSQSRRAALNMMTDAIEARERSEQLSQEIRRLNTELEQRVIERTVQLEAANKELEAFCYSVSHDLRAPLRHVDGYVELLVSRFRANLPEKGLHYLDTIAASAHQMGVLIDDLLQFSRTGRADMRLESTDMNQVLQESLTTLRESTSGRSIEWTINELPHVQADHSLMRQVWVNLLDNAVKYTKPREVARITVSARREKGEIVFSVADNGVGFNMTYIHKLFGVFQRLHSVEEFEGTGIGLATVQRIISRHGGRVWAEAELDKGATFYFTLPG